MKNKEQIEIIIEDFNFELVSSVMNSIGWVYNDSKKSPSVKELKALAKKCLLKALEDGHYSQGGFEADYLFGVLELKFVLDRVSPLSYIMGAKTEVNEQQINKIQRGS
jgi:hypothetical protein